MPHDDQEPTDGDSLMLLQALHSDAPAPPAAMTHVLNRLAISLPAGAIPAPNSRALESSDPAMGSSSGIGSSVLRHGVVAVARPWAWVVGLTLAGGLTGGALHAAFAPEKVRVVYVDRESGEASAPAASNGQGLVAESGEAPLPISALSSLPESPSPPSDPNTASSAATRSAWARERALLDVARRVLAAGEPERCLAELAKHARAFPSGKLAEEREALTINALVGVGRYSEARQKAELFAKRHPHSFLAPSVEAALLAIPIQ